MYMVITVAYSCLECFDMDEDDSVIIEHTNTYNESVLITATYEKNDYIGGHTHTHTIKSKDANLSVDSGFIVYNETTYPNFIKLLKKLNVESQRTTMGFSVKSINKNLEYAGNSLASLFAQKLNIIRPSFWIMIIDILRFNKKANLI